MLAAKLPLHLFEDFMRISHHDQPLEEEAAIVEDVHKAQHDARGVIRGVTLEDGTAELGRGPPAPTFAEEYGET